MDLSFGAGIRQVLSGQDHVTSHGHGFPQDIRKEQPPCGRLCLRRKASRDPQWADGPVGTVGEGDVPLPGSMFPWVGVWLCIYRGEVCVVPLGS